MKLPIPQYDWLCASSHVWQITLPSLNEESFVTQLTLPCPFARGIFNPPGERVLLAMLALLAILRYYQLMATIVIRNLDPAVKRKLQIRAAHNGRSMEAEARALLTEKSAETVQDVKERREVDLGTAIHRRFAALGGVDLKIPPRKFSNRTLPKFD
ncbi:MAG: hypothetical protein WBA18_07915 [Terracidiphilus sp.]